MAFTLADQYYLKALKEYPWDLEASVENLNYALSYDDEHIEALCLMGKLYLDQLSNPQEAEAYFVQALAVNPNQFKTLALYAYLNIHTKQFKKAKRIVRHLDSLKDADKAVVFHIKALRNEGLMKYAKSMKFLKRARMESCDDWYRGFLKNEISRIKEKTKDSKKRGK